MHDNCPATDLYLHFREKFKSRIAEWHQRRESSCSFSRLTGRVKCPVHYLKGRIADTIYHKLEKDGGYHEDVKRGVVKDLAILFADIRGFTRRTADMPPERIVAMLDLFVPEMLNIIVNRHQGMVDKLLGDGIMALYGHPYSKGNEIVQAIYSAIDMQQAAAALDTVLELGGYDPIEIGIGINRGKVLICEVGDDRYKETTVIGAPVNIAAKMEDVAGAQEIALPYDTMTLIEPVKPVMLDYFEDRGETNDVRAGVFKWRQYIENEQQEMDDWRIR